MASHSHTIDIQSEPRRLEGVGPRVMFAFIVGVAALAVAVFLKAAGSDMKQFMLSYLLSYMFVLSIALGCMFFVLIQHVVAAGWSVVVRRLAEQVMATMPLLTILVIPIVLFRSELYPWPKGGALNSELSHFPTKVTYYDEMFFIGRVVGYFFVWNIIAWYFRGASIRQDASGDASINVTLRKVAAPALIFYGVCLSFCSIDLMKSLSPIWFSTIFGVYWFAGCVLSGVSFLALLAMWVQARGKLTHAITTDHYHDLGKLMFAFVVFWAYIGFSQYMLIWYANIPEETGWFLVRQTGEWWRLALALLFGHFVVPFVLFISRHPKRGKLTLFVFAVWMLLMHWLDLFYITRPPPIEIIERTSDELLHPVNFHLLDGICFVGVAAIFWAGVVWRLGRDSLVPERDPWMKESLAFENY